MVAFRLLPHARHGRADPLALGQVMKTPVELLPRLKAEQGSGIFVYLLIFFIFPL